MFLVSTIDYGLSVQRSTSLSAFTHFVIGVVPRGSKKQMTHPQTLSSIYEVYADVIVPQAETIVTGVANVEPQGNLPASDHPRDSMSCRLSAALVGEDSIPSGCCCPGPIPANLGFCDPIPDALGQRASSLDSGSAGLAAKLSEGCSGTGTDYRPCFSTVRASKLDTHRGYLRGATPQDAPTSLGYFAALIVTGKEARN